MFLDRHTLNSLHVRRQSSGGAPMEYPTVNIAGLSKRRKLHGKEHLVVPMTLLVQGVLNGSKGPLFYPQNEICRSAADWNGVPIVVRHPNQQGRPTSARSPEVLEQFGVGQVLNARCQGDRLVADGWFDIQQTQRVDATLLASLVARQPVEVSTGLFTENEASRGTYHGREYTHIARNYRPDHLAVLPDQEGACSLRDGCGIFGVNSRDSDDEDDEPLIPPTIDWAAEAAHQPQPKASREAADQDDPDMLVPPSIDWKEWARSRDR